MNNGWQTDTRKLVKVLEYGLVLDTYIHDDSVVYLFADPVRIIHQFMDFATSGKQLSPENRQRAKGLENLCEYWEFALESVIADLRETESKDYYRYDDEVNTLTWDWYGIAADSSLFSLVSFVEDEQEREMHTRW